MQDCTRLVRNTGVLDTLYQELLAECVQNNQRENDHQTASITDCRIVERLTCIVGFKRSRDTDDIRHQDRLGSVTVRI